MRIVGFLIVMMVFSGEIAGAAGSEDYFQIRVVDRQTGRGVPLVELRTTNVVRYVTDSNGIVAFREPGLMGKEVFFFVESHGYEHAKDGFGYRGVRLKAVAGGEATVKVDRINVAERLYRVTGAGIYRDSVLTGHEVPIKEPVLNGQVLGQDSVYTCLYGGRLFWLWGDTAKAGYPLGHFRTASAFSSLPGDGGLDPDIGVDLEYFVDENGFSRGMCRMKEKGMYWLDGLIVVADEAGTERMVAKCARMKSLGEAYERGLVVYDDKSESFEWLVRSGADFLPYHNSGHAISVEVEGQRYHYFGTQFPLSVRMRVKDDWSCVRDVNKYEVLTRIYSREYQWVSVGTLLKDYSISELIKMLREEKAPTRLYDVETGKAVIPHGGSICFNRYRNRWVMIVVEQFGEASMLGDVWYAEADTPVGPWAYARKIATHEKYSFYNPMQHPYFEKDGGKAIYFEGTYTHTFSGSLETAAPRYDYNQLMYRLRVDDERLQLPVAVYQVDGKYLLRDDIEKQNRWEVVEEAAFFAIEPDTIGDEFVPIYQVKGRLTTETPNGSAKAVFFAADADNGWSDDSQATPLFEYRNTNTGEYTYSCRERIAEKDWERSKKPLCVVWKVPGGVLVDRKSRPVIRRDDGA